MARIPSSGIRVRIFSKRLFSIRMLSPRLISMAALVTATPVRLTKLQFLITFKMSGLVSSGLSPIVIGDVLPQLEKLYKEAV